MRCVKQFFKSLLRFFVDLPVNSYQWRLLRSRLVFPSFKTKVVALAAIVADQAFTKKTSPRWTVKYPEKGGYFCHKRRDIYGKLYKTFHFWLRQIQPMEILSFRLGWIYEHEILHTSFSSLLWRCFPCLMEMISYCFPCAQFSKGQTESLWSTWRLTRISRSFEPKQACTYTGSISQTNKHFNIKSLLSILFMQIIDSRP